MTAQRKTAAKVFTFLDPEILEGNGDIDLPRTDSLTGVVKRYAEGGENRFHSHPEEDHTFYILQGQARFHLEAEENQVVVGEHEAVLLPRGIYYRFESVGDEKLIMLRVGNGQNHRLRRDPEGRTIAIPDGFVAPEVPARELPF